MSRQSSTRHILWFVFGTVLGSGPRNHETFTGAGGKAIYNDSLPSAWTRKCIRPIDFAPADSIGGNIGWENVKDSLTNMTFFSGQGTDFWVDDIRLYGVNRDDLK